MESNTQTNQAGGGAAGASDSSKKVVREATAEEKRFALRIKEVPYNIFRGIVYYI